MLGSIQDQCFTGQGRPHIEKIVSLHFSSPWWFRIATGKILDGHHIFSCLFGKNISLFGLIRLTSCYLMKCKERSVLNLGGKSAFMEISCALLSRWRSIAKSLPVNNSFALKQWSNQYSGHLSIVILLNIRGKVVSTEICHVI